jgi:hypothetical protein
MTDGSVKQESVMTLIEHSLQNMETRMGKRREFIINWVCGESVIGEGGKRG